MMLMKKTFSVQRSVPEQTRLAICCSDLTDLRVRLCPDFGVGQDSFAFHFHDFHEYITSCTRQLVDRPSVCKSGRTSFIPTIILTIIVTYLSTVSCIIIHY